MPLLIQEYRGRRDYHIECIHGLIHLYMHASLEGNLGGYIPLPDGAMMGDFYFLLYNFLYFMK